MNGKYFIDTNIFVYSFDSSLKPKQKKAQAIIDQALTAHKGIISYQVIQEFLNVAGKKFSKALIPTDAILYLEKVLAPLCEILPSTELYKQTLEIQMEFKFSFYDTLIIASAIRGECKFIYSEDLQHGQIIIDVKIINPFL